MIRARVRFGSVFSAFAGCIVAAGCSDGGTSTGGIAASGGKSGSGGSVGSGGSAGSGGSVGSAGTAGSGGVPAGRGVGESCTDDQPCRSGLRCNAGVCEPGRSTGEGEACVLGAECREGLQCSGGRCAPSGGAGEGASCVGDISCASGLRCVLVGFGAQCAPDGTKDVGGDCAQTAECFGGLVCTDQKCGFPTPGAPFGGSVFKGVACEEPATQGPFRAYFEVPGAVPPGSDGDFFRLPFPNDVRVRGKKLDLAGFPRPGPGPLGYDPLARYIDALESTEHAWGTYPTVLFRFSGTIDVETLRSKQGVPDALRWVDITAGTPEYDTGRGQYWYVANGRSNYVCGPWLGVRRPHGAPLVPGHTYAVWITTAVRDTAGAPLERSQHLAAMLGSSRPADAALAAAYDAFAPFRAYLTSKAIDPGSVLNASVITAGAVRDPMRQLATAVLAAPAPAAKSWVKCQSGTASPCPDAQGERACGAGTDQYDEYHALVGLPIFQEGTPPYLDAGGGIASGAPVRTEDVCLSLTVPKGTMPAAGWPLVVFAHGTGGSFRSHVRPEVAAALAGVATPGGEVKLAVLGIDQVQHGPRRGESKKSPNDLFFNFGNPSAARGNPLQGAADQIALARFASALDLAASATGGDAIKINPAALVFYGHSQGATHGSMALAYTSLYKAAVFSGNGASLMHALLSKKSPVNVAAAVPIALGDFDGKELNGGDMHPALTLLQHWIDQADPLNFAFSTSRAPEPNQTSKHVFQTYGLGDNYSPAVTLETYALAAGLELAQHHASVTQPDPIGELIPKALPLSGNVTLAGGPVTLAVRQYAPPAGKDGHFVAFDVPDATRDVARFLAMAASGAVPQVGP